MLLVGMGTPIETLPMSIITRREIDLISVWRYANTYPRAMEIMQLGAQEGNNVPDVRRMLTHSFPLDASLEAFGAAGRTRDDDGNLIIKVVVNN